MPAKQHAAAVDAFAKVKLAKGRATISSSKEQKNKAITMSRGWQRVGGGGVRLRGVCIENDRNPNK